MLGRVFIFLFNFLFFNCAIAAGLEREEAQFWTARDICLVREFSAHMSLTESQKKVICDAAPFYNIDVLWGNNKVIVLLGEAHHHDEEEYIKGTRVVDQFDFRGYEQMIVNVKPEDRLKYRSRNNRTQIRTLSSDQAKVYNQKEFGSLIPYTSSKGTSFRTTFYHKEYVNLNGQRISNQAVQDYLQQNSSLDYPVNFHLERDSNLFDLVETVCSRYYPYNINSCPRDDIIIDARNEEMSESILEAFENFNEHNCMLVVLGASHSPGMIKILRSQGFAYHPIARGLSVAYAEKISLEESLNTSDY